MKKLFLAAFVIGALLFAGCLGGSEQPSATPGVVTEATATPTAAATATPEVTLVATATPVKEEYVETNKVAIQNGQYEPQFIKVSTGTKVTWENQDGVLHSVRSAEGSPVAFNSYNIPGRGLWSYTFDAPGKYEYYDDLGSKAVGVVQVA